MKTKWKSLRDGYVKRKAKYERERRSGAASCDEPSWPYYKFLKWLDPYLARSR